jgi:transposase
MKRTRDGRRRFTRDFKIAAVRRVLEGEEIGRVARDLEISFELLWRWKKRVVEEGEEYLYDIGERSGSKATNREASKERRIAELERLVGRRLSRKLCFELNHSELSKRDWNIALS